VGASLAIRRAGPGDASLVARFIRDLARYEKLEHQIDVDEGRLREHLGGAVPACGALIAELDGAPIGFALFFQNYSTFRTRPCLYLEDLFVQEQHRGRGVGLELLRAVAAEAVARGCPRLDWSVLDWNEPAIGFYRAQGARMLDDWRIFRLDGEALARAAAAATRA
jgi:GNAT superfamily N-acetyltransferase